MTQWYSDGQAIDSISVDDRAAQYGDGLFETIAIRKGQARFWPLHVARLQTGCVRLGIRCPSEESLQAELQFALAQSPQFADFATAKLLLSAGCSPRGYQRSAASDPIIRIGIFAARQLPRASYRDGVEVRICASRLAMQPQLAGIKSLNRLEQVLARAEWDDDTVFEGLMLDTGGRLICGTMSNMFIVTESGLHTPALTRCGVSGVMRRQLFGLLQIAGIECESRDIRGEELDSATEVFLCNSQFGVLPVRRCGRRQWAAGPVTRQVQALLVANGVPECAP